MAPTQRVVLHLNTTDIEDNSDCETDESSLKIQKSHVSEQPEELIIDEKLLDEPSDKDTIRLNPFWSYVVSLITLSIYAYGLYTLFTMYQNNHFLKDTAPISRNLLQSWTPIFFLSVLVELAYGYYKKAGIRFSTGDLFCSFAILAARTVTTRFTAMTVLCYGLYGVVWHNFGVHIHEQVFPVFFKQSAILQFLSIIVLDEFVYYWVHRTGHTINALWAFHSMHHNGEFYNLSLAFRNSILVRFSTILYYLPLALFFDPPVFIIFRQFNLVYQFWIHTETVGKLGWLEYILNTPSLHRVHHGRNAYCIDKNFGGMTCIFDLIFGTYQQEIDEVPVVYGLTSSYNTFDAWKLNWYPWKLIWDSIQRVQGFDKLRVLYYGPGWIPGTHPPQNYSIPPCTRKTFQRYNPTVPIPVYLVLFFNVIAVVRIFSAPNSVTINGDGPFVFTVTCLYFIFAIYSQCAVANRLPNCFRLQVWTVVLGISLFSIWAYQGYNPEMEDSFSKMMRKIVTYIVIGAFIISVMRYYRNEIQKPLAENEVGKDAPNAAEVEKMQWAFYERSKQTHSKTQ